MTMGPELLVGQFILCREQDLVPSGWPVRSHGGWRLGHHPRLPVVDIHGADGAVIGWLLGYPISPEGRLVTEAVRFPVSPAAPDAPSRFEAALYEYGGRWAAALLAAQTSRFYLDPCGSLAAVHCLKQHIVASTPTLIPYLEGCGDNHDLIRAIAIPRGDNYYPFGMTPRHGVERILPNHYLDLAMWKTFRHWPTGEVPPCPRTDSAVLELAGILRTSIAAIAQQHPLYLALTAGRDSRMLLACSRTCLDNIVSFTAILPWGSGTIDCQIAFKLANQLGLNHVILPFVRPTRSDVAECVYRQGNCVYGKYTLIDATYRQLDPQRPILLGANGELGRSFHWRDGDTECTRISAHDLLEKRKIPVTAAVQDRAQEWLSSLPVRNTLTIWGLLYNEQFNGCWFGPLLYGLISNAFFVFPFCHRRAIEIMLGLPSEYRRQKALEIDLIKHLWPELLDLPFNWPVGIQRCMHAVTWRVALIRARFASLLSAGLNRRHK